MIRSALVALFILAGAAANPAGAIDFADSLEAARAMGGDRAQQPVVLTFSAAWCGWCRKMDVTTFRDPAVEALSEKALFVKVDADENTELSARYGVRGLPHTIVLDVENRLIGSQAGYLSAEALVKFVTAAIENPQPLDAGPREILDQLAKLGDSDERSAVVLEAVEWIAQRDAVGREDVVAALHARFDVAAPELAAALNDERLAVRAAAAGVLMRRGDGALQFDPFAAVEVRKDQAKAWQAWAEKASKSPAPASNPEPAAD